MYIKTLLLPHHGSKEDLGYKSKVLKAIDHVKLNDMLYSTLHSCLTLVSMAYGCIPVEAANQLGFVYPFQVM